MMRGPTARPRRCLNGVLGRRDVESSKRRSTTIQGKAKPRKLLAYQHYFGLEARTFHAGAKRMLERVSAQAPGMARINARHLSEDFRLNAEQSGTLLRAFLAGGLLYPDGDGGYEPSERFREYAHARVVVPVRRSQAKELVKAACRFAEGINADSHRNPFQIETIAVSGSYMSRCDLLPELSLWLVLRRRPQSETTRSMSKDDACHHIKTTMKGLNPAMVVRLTSDTQKVERPFSIVFEAKDVVIESPPRPWERLRDWSVSISQRVVSRPPHLDPAAVAPMELVTQQRGPRTRQGQFSAWGKVGKRG